MFELLRHMECDIPVIIILYKCYTNVTTVMLVLETFYLKVCMNQVQDDARLLRE